MDDCGYVLVAFCDPNKPCIRAGKWDGEAWIHTNHITIHSVFAWMPFPSPFDISL